MPTWAATAARGALVVTGEQHRPQAEPRSAAHGLALRRLDRVGDDEHARGRTVPADDDGGATRRLGRRVAARARRRGAAPVGEELRPADDDGVAVDDAVHAEARGWRRTRHTGSARSSGSRRRGDGAAIGCSEASSSEPASRRPVGASSRRPATTSTRLIGPVVTVPVLSSTMVSTWRVDSEHLGALDQDAELRAAAGADHQRRRRGQPERARAGDDQHGDRGGERASRPSRRRRARSRGWRRRWR